MQNIKADGYAGVDSGTHVCFFLSGIDKPSLKTANQICESQASYNTNFHACASYLASMMNKTPTTKQVHIAASATEVDGIKLKNRDGSDQCLPPSNNPGRIYKSLSTKQKEWLWQDHKET